MDTISKRGVTLVKTLAEKILRDFSRIKLKKATIKVPRLKVGKQKLKSIPEEDDKLPVSSLINILVKNAVEKAKRERKEKVVEDDKSYTVLKDERDFLFNGGYGTVSKGYGSAPHKTYVDYGKLFSYLGKFKSQSPYENMTEHLGTLNKSSESGSFTLVDRETMEKGKFYVRYINSKIPIDKTSLVPISGMNSAEWEEFKWFMRLDTAMYLLKISTS